MHGQNARLIDIPYHTTEPIQFVGEVTAPLIVNKFIFPNELQSFTPPIALLDTNLYIINSVSFSMNIPESVFQGALIKKQGIESRLPSVQLYTTGTGNSPLWRTGFYCPKYFDDFNYIKTFLPRQSPNNLKFIFSGSLDQSAELTTLGLDEITAYFVLSVSEINDDTYVSNFKKRFEGGHR